MNSKEEFLAAAQVILCLMEDEIDSSSEDSSSEEELKICRKRRVWVKPSLQRRPYHSLENKLIADLLNDGESSFKNFCRLNVETFEILHSMIENEIKKGETQMRETISSRVRLATTLRYVASGCSQKSLEFLTRISRSTISLFIPEVVKAIYANLRNEYLKKIQNVYQEKCHNFIEELSIDVIYTWVNGSDERFNQSISKYKKNYDITRFDDKNELRFSLRSLEKYAPWIRHVYIVTNGQIPHWLDLSYSKVSIVTHKELAHNIDNLPTFSSSAIETFIHRIPNLSKKFLYMNDIFLNAELFPEDLYTNADGVKVYNAWTVPDCALDCLY